MYALVMKHKKVEKEKKTTKVKKPKQVRAGASSSVDGGSTETESARAQKRKRKKVEHGDGKKGKTSTPATAAAATDGTSTYDLAQFTLSPEPVPVQAWLSKAGKKKEKKKAARAAFLASRSSKATAAAAQAMEEDQDDTDEPYFIKAESKTFEGSRPGYVFKLGAKGHGYYRELQAAAAEDEEDEEAEEDEAEQEDAEKDLEKVEGGEGNNKESANGEGRPVKKQHRVNGQRGVSWVDLVIGNGPQKPIKGRFALIRYVARLNNADGPMFDSSEESQQQKPIYKNTIQKKPSKPARLKLGNNPPWGFKYGKDQVIVGLEIGMKSMWEGGKRVIQIPWTVGYGRGGTKKVPPMTDMSFEVELVGVGS
eukprot:gene4839-7858_t